MKSCRCGLVTSKCQTASMSGPTVRRPTRTPIATEIGLIYLGPRSQKVLRPFLDRPTTAFLFSPAEAMADRRAAASEARKTPPAQGNGPGTNRVESPRKRPGDRYTPTSYLRSIQKAGDRGFPPPIALARRADEAASEWSERLSEREREQLAEWRKTHRWTPYQLRHNAATTIRARFGLEAAQIALGHSSAILTDAVYAERDCTQSVEIARRLG